MCGICTVDYEQITEGEKCRCGGDIDTLYSINNTLYNLWRGRCFVCQRDFDVIRLGNEG